MDHAIESLNGSSMCLHGTSLEDIKEATLNMQVPKSQNKKTKTEAESKRPFEVGNLDDDDINVGTGGNIEHIIDFIYDEDLESNYVTNGSYA